jgi:hypothetical protein
METDTVPKLEERPIAACIVCFICRTERKCLAVAFDMDKKLSGCRFVD